MVRNVFVTVVSNIHVMVVMKQEEVLHVVENIRVVIVIVSMCGIIILV